MTGAGQILSTGISLNTGVNRYRLITDLELRLQVQGELLVARMKDVTKGKQRRNGEMEEPQCQHGPELVWKQRTSK